MGRPENALPPTVAAEAYLVFYERIPAAAHGAADESHPAPEDPAESIVVEDDTDEAADAGTSAQNPPGGPGPSLDVEMETDEAWEIETETAEYDSDAMDTSWAHTMTPWAARGGRVRRSS